MSSYEHPWLFRGQPFESSDIRDYHGFVYKITNTIDGTAYIGKKFFWSMAKQPGKSRRKRIESNWKKYWGSSDIVKGLVREFGPSMFLREIVSLHLTPGQVNYTEVKVQFQLDVLESTLPTGKRAYYNENIAARYFVPKHLAQQSMTLEEHCQHLRDIQSGKQNNETQPLETS